MNRVAIYGGLGNQMFQYALAIAMDASGIPTRISVNDYLVNRHYQGFELLKAFNVAIPIRDRFRIYAMNRLRPILVDVNISLVKSITTKLLISSSNVYKEPMEFSYDENVFEQESSYLVGTWQSLKYFESQKKLIKEVFNFNKPRDPFNLKFVNDIESRNSVAVHVRRGDFTKPELSDSRMLYDSLNYYHEAFTIINDSVDNPVFYIFSDDIQWAKENFKGFNFVFVSHNKGSKSYLDMYLMSLCQHFIIANSSFSWWAAWLADNPGKKVIMPRLWVNKMDCSSIYPEDWISLDVNSVKSSILS
ncbi:alpha-1,2-fucosyltransferase [Algoriphagus antarcticus]|uniref:Glycosyl transferase family 11 n=1 Tax=Algoriphagus antarcticus TaxID=238540 RepID=A0A3E0D2K1_9BACT|nr:alpha-1,2-fucosyltransferase [Algoriphagus antarcticus]REG76920.1 glycosyl transferase family 11 [Algoriphagus antarcticus]